MALTQISTDGIKNGTITGSDLATNVDLVDDQKIRFGNGTDLSIYHDGTDNFIQSTGKLYISSNTFVDIRSHEDETMIKATPNGAVELYNNNSKKFETTSGGVEIPNGSVLTVQTTSTSNGFLSFLDIGNVGYEWKFPDNSTVQFGTNHGSDKRLQLNNEDASSHFHFSLADNGKMLFGNNDDLQIYHTGSHTFFENSSGHTCFRAGGGQFQFQPVSGEKAIYMYPSGSVELYFNNSLRLSTTANGVTLGHNLFLDNATNAGRDVTWDPANDQLQWKDDTKASFGSSSDLQIYHDGSNSYISDNGTGGLFIQGSGGGAGITLEDPDGNDFIKCIDEGTGGAVELYKAGTKRLETTTTGVTVTGQIISDGLQMGDSDRAKFGSHDDLQIYHDGSHSRIDETGTGNLMIQSNNAVFIKKGTSENIATFNVDDAVELYYNNVKKFQTTNGGINITGSVACSGGASNNLSLPDNGKAKFGTSDDLQIYHNGSHSVIQNDTGTLFTLADNLSFKNNANNETLITAAANGAVELYYDNTKRLETVTDGAKCTGALEIFGVNNGVTAPLSANNRLRFTDNDSTTASAQPVGTIEWYTNDGNNRGISGFISVQAETDQAAGRMVFGTGTADASETMRLDQNGRLHIGKTNAIGGENRLTVMNESSAKVASFHHNHDSQKACLDCTNGHATGGQSAIMIEFRRADGGSVGGIFASTSATSYNSASDYRLKENEVLISDGITRLKTLKPYRFNWKEDKDKIVDGFFAHEVSSVIPEAITGTKDEVDENNDPVYQGIDQSKLVPLLVAAVQEAISKIEVLETEVAALKAA